MWIFEESAALECSAIELFTYRVVSRDQASLMLIFGFMYSIYAIARCIDNWKIIMHDA